jgi:predicted nuclease with TOPRIM domain
MRSPGTLRRMRTGFLILAVLIAHSCFAGVSRAIQDKYKRAFENKALFLKVPVFADRQVIQIRGRAVSSDKGVDTGTPRFKVGDQVRVTTVDFGGEEVRFKLLAISGGGICEIVFRFDAPLQENFPNSDVFDDAVQMTFTEGLKYADLEEAKKGYVEDQFERVVREMASTSGSSREAVLKNMAPRIPAYQDALRDIENLKSRNQDLSGQITQQQAEYRRLEGELRSQTAEVSRLRSANQALQEKIDSSASQLSRLGDDLRSVRGANQGYQKELANLQRSLNLKVDANRDLGAQISDLAQALKRLQKDNETLEAQGNTLRAAIEKLQTEKAKLTGELEDAKNSNQKMRETIGTLTSKEDSLARQYLDLKKRKEILDTVLQSIETISARTLEEKVEGGFSFGKARVFLKEIPLGTLEWKLPSRLSGAERQPGEVSFTSESIDYVRVTAEERAILRSLGDRLKMQVKLSSAAPSFDVLPDKDGASREIGEREKAAWRWTISNNGTQDARLLLGIRFITRNADEIPLIQHEQLVASSSVVRQVRDYLQPIPMAVGAVIGFLLFGVVGVFRRTRHHHHGPRPPAAPDQAATFPDKKKL